MYVYICTFVRSFVRVIDILPSKQGTKVNNNKIPSKVNNKAIKKQAIMQANKQATIEATSLHILPGSSNFPARATSNSTGEILLTKGAMYFLEETSERCPRPQVKHDDLS